MDRSRFTNAATGSLIGLGAKSDEWAFVPNPLPPDWEFPAELWPALSDAKACLGTLNGIGRTLPNPQLLLRPLQDRESLRSSSLEGTHATPADLLLFEQQPREPKSDSDPANAWKEVWNYGTALRRGMALMAERPLSTAIIKEMHKTLLTGVRGKEKMPGQFRRDQVHIGSDRRYVPPPASYIDDLMFNLQDYMNTDDNLDPLIRCFVVHYQFEAIHPFLDGNGRVGRALLALMVQSLLKHTMPWLYMSAFFERYKDEYIENMFAVSAVGDWKTWLEFCIRGTIYTAKDAVRRCDGLKCVQQKYHQILDMNRPRIHSLIDRIFTTPMLTKPDAARQLDVAYKTASSDIDFLVERGVLKELPESNHPKAYYAPEIFDIAFREPTEWPPLQDSDDPHTPNLKRSGARVSASTD